MVNEFDLLTLENDNKYLVNSTVQYNGSNYLLLTNINNLKETLYTELESDGSISVLDESELKLKEILSNLFLEKYNNSKKKLNENNIHYDRNNKNVFNYAKEIFSSYPFIVDLIIKSIVDTNKINNVSSEQFLNYFPNIDITLLDEKSGLISYSNNEYKISAKFMNIFENLTEITINKI